MYMESFVLCIYYFIRGNDYIFLGILFHPAWRLIMGFLEVILVCLGISFDVLAVSVCQGAVLQKIDKLPSMK